MLELFSTHKKKSGRSKKTNGSEVDQIIQKLENNLRKTLATLRNSFLLRGLLFGASDAISNRGYEF